MPNDTTEKILYGIFGLLVCAGLVLLYKFYTLKGLEQGDIAPIAPGQLARPRVDIGKPNRFKEQPGTPSLSNGLRAKPMRENPIPKPKLEERIQIQSQLSKQKFNKQAFINMEWPGHLHYIEPDLEDGMKTIYGYNTLTKEGLTAVARPAPTTIDEIKEYLKNDKDVIPNLNGKKILKISEPQNIRGANAREGISDIQVISANLSNGESAHFAVVNRQDKKGSYVFIYTAPPGTVEQNDGYIERIYTGIRALDPKKK